MSVVVGWNSSTHIFLLDAEITEGEENEKIPISVISQFQGDQTASDFVY